MTPAEVHPQRPSRCPICGKAELQLRIRSEQFAYEADHTNVAVVAENVPVEACPACGEVFSGPAAWAIRDEARCRAVGVLTPAEVRALRERLGLTLPELSHLSGIGEDVLTHWEAGHLIPDRAMDRYLRLLAAHPENLQYLTQLPQPANGQRTAPDQSLQPSKAGK